MPNDQRVIAFIVASPFDLLNLIGLTSVFGCAKTAGTPAYVTKILSANSEREIRSADGLAVSNSIPFFEYSGPIDTLVAIGGEEGRNYFPDVVLWIRANAARARRMACVGNGAFMFASTGLIDGKRVTAHWHHVEKLAKQYPRLQVKKDQIFVKDGNLYSTAGVSAGIDMALALVEEDLGHAAAISIARQLVLYMRRPGNVAQQSSFLTQQANVGGTPMRDLPAWAKMRITQRLDVARLAKAVAMTPRTFARHFQRHFGTTPARWIESLMSS